MSYNSEISNVLPLQLYLLIGSVLLVLTGVTVTISFFNFGAFNLVIAMAVATVKALLVAL
jgi:cytochrome c oxidase subunit 4